MTNFRSEVVQYACKLVCSYGVRLFDCAWSPQHCNSGSNVSWHPLRLPLPIDEPAAQLLEAGPS